MTFVLGIFLFLSPIVVLIGSNARLNGLIASLNFYQNNGLSLDISAITLQCGAVVLFITALLTRPIREFNDRYAGLLLLTCFVNVFLHPLGLALEVCISDDGKETLDRVWDYREDEEGIYYNLKDSTQERINKFKEKAKFINDEFNRVGDGRSRILGFRIEPIPEKN